MPASTAPEAKRRILTLLAARPALAGVQRTWMAPTETEDFPQGGELLYLTDTIIEGEFRILGAGLRDERYTIGLGVYAQQYGDDAQAVEERSWQILDEISAALFSDKYLAGLLMMPVEILSANQRPGVVSPEQLGSRIDARIRCVARFTP